MKKLIRSPLFPAIVAAPVLFGIGALVLSLPEYDGPWYYFLYYLLHVLSAGAFFYGLHRAFRTLPDRGAARGFTAAIPVLLSLSVYHFAIAFFDAYAVQYEEGSGALVYALLSLFTDSILAEWGLLALLYFCGWLLFLRGEATPARRRAAFLLSALLYFAYLSAGRVTEYLSYRSARFGVADEETVFVFLLFSAADLLISALGFLILFLGDRANKREVV